jgi:16S rRNA (cytidine1402-2'-O)-methyltransferase
MSAEPKKPEPGLYFISTPIGSARDITLRAIDLLAGVDVLAAEDTRTLRHLMDIHGIGLGGRPLVAYHDHNGAEARPRILAELAKGRSVAYASEAGTPLVADPGYQLARAAIEAGHRVTAAPGPSAAIMALTVSGLASDRFLFAGFAPPTQAARRKWLEELARVPATLVLYEAPGRVRELFADLLETCGGDRQAAVCRELTKRFEEVLRGSVQTLAGELAGRDLRGEVVVLVDRERKRAVGEDDIRTALLVALRTMRVKEAAAFVAETYGLPRRELYQMALEIGQL